MCFKDCQPYDKERLKTFSYLLNSKSNFHYLKTLLMTMTRTFLIFFTLSRDQSLQGQGLPPLTNTLQLSSSIYSATQLYCPAQLAQQKLQLSHCKTMISISRLFTCPQLLFDYSACAVNESDRFEI